MTVFLFSDQLEIKLAAPIATDAGLAHAIARFNREMESAAAAMPPMGAPRMPSRITAQQEQQHCRLAVHFTNISTHLPPSSPVTVTPQLMRDFIDLLNRASEEAAAGRVAIEQAEMHRRTEALVAREMRVHSIMRNGLSAFAA